MLAVIDQAGEGYIARFERHMKHSIQEVWSYLTENEKLKLWFSELSVEELRVGGVINFDMGLDNAEELTILEFKQLSLLEYTWGEDRVRFELNPETDGCRLVLIEKIARITEHTPRDLAGWHVCLDVIEALLRGETLEARKNEWEKRYKQYAEVTNPLLES